jgi:UDP:flavonoid glycosyltransferase YjiC (YdhE family)
VRAIIQTKTSADEGRDGDLYFMRWAPHAWLAPHCALFVHHGGAGTSHAALRAGLPSVVLPFIFEQGLWAKRLRQIGAAERALSFWRAKPERVGDRIRALLASERARHSAGRLARAMEHEDGAATAARRLELLLR